MSVGAHFKGLRLAALGAFVVALAVAGSATALPRDSMTSSGHSFPRFAYVGTDNNLWLSSCIQTGRRRTGRVRPPARTRPPARPAPILSWWPCGCMAAVRIRRGLIGVT